MKLVATNILVFLIAHALLGQTYSGPIPKPISGYGSEGTHTVGVASFSNPYYPSEDIKIYYPSDISTQVPTLFYSHAFGGFIPLHVLGVFNFFAKNILLYDNCKLIFNELQSHHHQHHAKNNHPLRTKPKSNPNLY